MDPTDQIKKLVQENKNLRIQLKVLKKSYEQLKRSYKKDQTLIKSLYKELGNKSKNFRSLNKSLLADVHETSEFFSIEHEKNEKENQKTVSPSHSTGKTPQANPDQSVNLDQSGGIFQGFFVVGVKKTKALPLIPEIIFEYCPDPTVFNNEIKKIIPDLCFPNGLMPIENITEENSKFSNEKTGKKFSIFTLKAEVNFYLPLHENLPNNDQDLLYFMCILFNPSQRDSDLQEELFSKCYVLASYTPVFELHFELLQGLLTLRETSQKKFTPHEELSKEEIKLLNDYSGCESLVPSMLIELPISNFEIITYKSPEDLSVIDIGWLCAPLFSTLKFTDFFWLISAILQEKSVIFVSSNLDLLSSCVLGIQSLLRPFKWPSLSMPIVPKNLIDLLQAPVPLLVGISEIEYQERLAVANVIWVFLDEPIANRRIQGPSAFIQEIIEPEAPQLRKNLHDYYQIFENEQEINRVHPQALINCLKIARELKNYFQTVIDVFKSNFLDEFKFTSALLKKFPIYDHKFIRALSQTLIFNNKLQEFCGLINK